MPQKDQTQLRRPLNRHAHYVLFLLDWRSAPGICGGIQQSAAIKMQIRSLPALS